MSRKPTNTTPQIVIEANALVARIERADSTRLSTRESIDHAYECLYQEAKRFGSGVALTFRSRAEIFTSLGVAIKAAQVRAEASKYFVAIPCVYKVG